jgi:hypothetical protein
VPFTAGKSLIDAVLVGGQFVVRGGEHLQREQIVRRYAETLQRLAA